MTDLTPVKGPRAVCPVCGSDLLGVGVLTHNDDGSHGWIPGSEVLTRDLSSGKIHRRTLVNGEYQSFEHDNLDEAGEYEIITAEQMSDAEPGELCDRCFAEPA